jgi:N,N'-diacetyllegionaminate synthase
MKKVFIIAEAGVNHNGDINIAYRLIDEAVKAKVDAVKFQTAVPELVMIPNAKKAKYQEKLTGSNENQLSMAKRIHLPLDAYKKLKDYCDKKKILFLSTPFDLKSIDTLEEINLSIYKIPSGEITNLPYLRKIASLNKPIIISTGMANISEIESSLKVFLDAGLEKEKISILHCNTEYPTPYKDVNLKAMLSLYNYFGVKVGYSDHTEGIEVPIAAVAMGAKIIEKHFTLDRNMEGPDHKASLDPKGLNSMVKAIRNIEMAISGTGIKEASPSEKRNITAMRKSIYLCKKVGKGALIEESDIISLRPGNGLTPMAWDSVIGRKTRRSMEPYEKLTFKDLE